MVAKIGADRGDAKNRRTPAKEAPPRAEGIEERFVQSDSVSLRLLLNRRTKTMRVIDFRAGASHAKRLFVLKLAAKEGIEKVYTLVERDEVGTWLKLGFAKEANIPGFYKRSDAFLMGTLVAEALREASLLRATDDDDIDGVLTAEGPLPDAMERTLVAAKKHAKALLDHKLPQVKLTPVRDESAAKAVDKALRRGRALTAFEPFGRDVRRRAFEASARGGFELVVSVESQSCFDNGFVELLTSPETEAERLGTIATLQALCDMLMSEGVVSCFALAPSDDVALATAFVFNGFRRTGMLRGHLFVGSTRKDAVVWSRKLASPNES